MITCPRCLQPIPCPACESWLCPHCGYDLDEELPFMDESEDECEPLSDA